MSTITEPTTAHEPFPCPSWCEVTLAEHADALERDGWRTHTSGEVSLTVVDAVIGLWAASEEHLTARTDATSLTRPLMRLAIDRVFAPSDALLTVDQLLSLSDMCARAAIVLGQIEGGASK